MKAMAARTGLHHELLIEGQPKTVTLLKGIDELKQKADGYSDWHEITQDEVAPSSAQDPTLRP